MIRIGGGYPLLLTASVDTRGMKGAMFSAEDREQMYVSTLNYYIGLFEKRAIHLDMVFAENSGWDLMKMAENIHKSEFAEIEYLSFNPNDFDQTKGKSYNELLMMQKAIDSSKTIQEKGRFIKLTGRFPVMNLDKLLKELYCRGGETLAFFGDCKDHKVYDYLGMKINGHSGESRFYAMSLAFWNMHFRDCYMELNDFKGRNIEGYLLALKRETCGAPNVVWRLHTQPHFSGKGGHNIGKGVAFFHSTNNDSSIMTFKRGLRQLCRWVMPWWWC